MTLSSRDPKFGFSSIRSRIFARSTLILFVITLSAAIISGSISIQNTKTLKERRVVNLVDRLKPSFAYAAFQINDFGIQTLLNTLTTLPEVRGAVFSGDFQQLTSPPEMNEWEIFVDCEVVYVRDLSGLKVMGEDLPKGEYRICAKFTVLTTEAVVNFLWLILPQFLSILIVSAAILRLVDTEIIRRIVDLMERVQDQNQLLVQSDVHVPDEISALESALVERTQRLCIETATADIVFENGDSFIAFTDLDNQVTRSNRRFRALFAPEDTVGEDIRLSAIFDRIDALAPGVWTDVALVDNSKELEIEAYLVNVQIPGVHQGRVYMFRDLTEKRHMERRTVQAQRMSAIGALSGGVAHDFNNLLGVVLGCAELSLCEPNLPDGARELLENIRNSANRGAVLTDKLLTFARRQKLNSKAMDPHAVVEQIGDLARRVIGTASLVSTDVASTRWVETDSSYLESSLLNLVLNARDAMPDGGTIRITASDAVRGGRHMVVFSVEDDGVGIPPDLIDKVREPFFTTKEGGKGKGLGLPMVAGFAGQSGGSLDITSRPGATRASIILPAIEPPETSAALQEPVRAVAADTGKPRVLVVEDEKLFAQVQETILSKEGFEVETASGMQEVTTMGDLSRFEIVLCDVVLVGHYGYEIWRHFRDNHLKTPFLFMSGNIPSEVEGLIEGTSEPLLRKPFETKTLLEALQSTSSHRSSPVPA